MIFIKSDSLAVTLLVFFIILARDILIPVGWVVFLTKFYIRSYYPFSKQSIQIMRSTSRTKIMEKQMRKHLDILNSTKPEQEKLKLLKELENDYGFDRLGDTLASILLGVLFFSIFCGLGYCTIAGTKSCITKFLLT